MPDISMCSGIGCPLREECYRYKAIPNEFRQSYFAIPPYDKEKKECDYFSKIFKKNENIPRRPETP